MKYRHKDANLEKEFNYTNSLQPNKEMPEYWRTLGSSKSRTTEQESMSRQTRAVRGSDYSPAIALSEEKDNLVTENSRDRKRKK